MSGILNLLMMDASTDWIDSEIYSQPLNDPEYIEATNSVEEVMKEIALVDPKAGKYGDLSQRLDEAISLKMACVGKVCYKKGFQAGARHIIALLSGDINSI